MSTWVVLPTYNEAENIVAMIEAVRRVVDTDILVVDDGSPDGTGRVVDELATVQPKIHVLHRSGKMGLGSAYRQGFQYALDHGATTVIQMDADGSHDPQLIPRMVAALGDVDLVLGSRYISGGRFPIVWYRRWISTCGNLYIRLLLGWSVHDWSTGYKAWRAAVLPGLLALATTSQGYAWLMEMTWASRQSRLRITEVPLVFLERLAGRSKFTWRIAAEDIRVAWRLARRRVTLARE